MFVLSMKTTRPRLAAYGVVLALLMTVMVVGHRQQMRVQSVSTAAADAARVTYLQQQGYAVEPQWTDLREVVAPDTDAVPAAYRGKRLKCYTYAVAGEDTVRLYEYNGKSVGALPVAQP